MGQATLAAVASLVLFCLVIVAVLALVIRPVTIRLSRSSSTTLTLSYAIAPVLGSLLLLAVRSLTLQQFWAGVRGDEHIKPYGIVILFMSLAYQAASLDATGGLAWLALHITAWSRGRGRRLFIFWYTFSGFLTTFTSNDICIMTLTWVMTPGARRATGWPLVRASTQLNTPQAHHHAHCKDYGRAACALPRGDVLRRQL
jgi:Na+/H+ antiporter NhaD/arsenite permease-like protein